MTAHCRSFHARLKAAAGSALPGGCWRGEWRSDASGHRGPLRCVIEPMAPRLWRASFHAGYARVFRACYATQLSVVETDGCWRFTGTADLGLLAGGVYEYDGEATVDAFHAHYRSRHDHGIFDLRRVDHPS